MQWSSYLPHPPRVQRAAAVQIIILVLLLRIVPSASHCRRRMCGRLRGSNLTDQPTLWGARDRVNDLRKTPLFQRFLMLVPSLSW
jgi:hypothetical protein